MTVATFGPGPAASSLIDFVEAWRRAQAIQSVQEQAAPAAADAGTVTEFERTVEEVRARLNAASEEAQRAHTAARQAYHKERSRWLGKKDWASVLKLYERALELGYPAESDIKDIRKKMQGN
jgi:hypothetical protein